MSKTKTQLANELRATKNLLKSEKQARDLLSREFQALKNNVETIRAGVQSTADIEQRLADAQDQVRDLIARLDTESKEHALSQMRLLKRAQAAAEASQLQELADDMEETDLGDEAARAAADLRREHDLALHSEGADR